MPLPIRLLIALLLAGCSQLCLALNIAFINPGRHDEPFWRTAGEAMQAAAQSLGVQFEQLFAERDPERMVQLARDIAARAPAQRPDYVILVNEKGTLVQSAQVLGSAGIKSFAAFNGLLPQDLQRFAPRRGLPLLMGSLESPAEEAGYLTMKTLIRQAAAGSTGQRLQLLAINGDRSTPVSIQRNNGMRRALAEHPEVELLQQSFADWRRDLAEQQAGALLARHPGVRMIWTASDLMAFGAMDAASRAGRKPGQDLFFASINTSKEAMLALIDGRLSSLAGGHFLAGAWAIVMLYDLHGGRDFAQDEGLTLQRSLFMQFGQAEARRYLARYGEGIKELDFRRYSKLLNPAVKRYAFDSLPLLR
ncbi:ABC transporter substrate-binding protein [Paucibacter sp. APW11]|uniref:ABC transporter substrate-binding protein n=1 Tax=Roseateles aquae TaxID=3077235 RepID=A0ABU3PG61_9BURK|nr:ABC transporter substrate-binding protein [Paucibacter sp. APW11]MDT9001554.1 ABC transporter substrate-binding protein [Paucibacter sp. APW11]